MHALYADYVYKYTYCHGYNLSITEGYITIIFTNIDIYTYFKSYILLRYTLHINTYFCKRTHIFISNYV